MLLDLLSRWPVMKQIREGGDGTGAEAMSERTRTLAPKIAGAKVAVSILELIGNEKSRALNLLGIAASANESFAGLKLESERTRVNGPLRKGVSGIIVRLGGILSGPVPLLLRLAFAIGGNRNLRRAAAWSSIAGSLLTRFGWIRAGHASARDYTLPLELASSRERGQESDPANLARAS